MFDNSEHCSECEGARSVCVWLSGKYNCFCKGLFFVCAIEMLELCANQHIHKHGF